MPREVDVFTCKQTLLYKAVLTVGGSAVVVLSQLVE